ncbi:MAG: divergent polysaccharide deacetylase family protein [Pseudomonadota bacterium]
MADHGLEKRRAWLAGMKLPGVTDIVFGILTALALFVLGWIVVVDDPLGGQPVAVVSLADIEPPAEPSLSDSQTPPSAPSLTDVPEDIAPPVRDTRVPQGVLIIDASRGDGPVRVPSADPALSEAGPHGSLPRVGDDGRISATYYARPAPPLEAGAPRIALVLTGLGLSVSASEDAIRRLPGGVTLAFAPYGRDVPRIAANASQGGHELMLQVPLEPFDYPDNDPGPHTLLTNLAERQNTERLHWVMSRFMGYTGVVNYMGARFVASERALEPFLTELRDRGLLMLDDGSSPQSRISSIADRLGLPVARADVVVDAVPRRGEIDQALADLEQLALSRGYAVGSASALPVSVQAIEDWTRDLESRGITLVPLTAIVFRGSS